MKKTVELIIADIQDQINNGIHEENDPDEASWNYQIGVLITASDAQAILLELTRLQTENDELKRLNDK